MCFLLNSVTNTSVSVYEKRRKALFYCMNNQTEQRTDRYSYADLFKWCAALFHRTDLFDHAYLFNCLVCLCFTMQMCLSVLC